MERDESFKGKGRQLSSQQLRTVARCCAARPREEPEPSSDPFCRRDCRLAGREDNTRFRLWTYRRFSPRTHRGVRRRLAPPSTRYPPKFLVFPQFNRAHQCENSTARILKIWKVRSALVPAQIQVHLGSADPVHELTGLRANKKVIRAATKDS